MCVSKKDENQHLALKIPQMACGGISSYAIISHLYSAMPRGPMKAFLSYCIPETYYRPFYSLASALLVQLLIFCWHPMPTIIWDFQHPILWYIIMGKKWSNLC